MGAALPEVPRQLTPPPPALHRLLPAGPSPTSAPRPAVPQTSKVSGSLAAARPFAISAQPKLLFNLQTPSLQKWKHCPEDHDVASPVAGCLGRGRGSCDDVCGVGGGGGARSSSETQETRELCFPTGKNKGGRGHVNATSPRREPAREGAGPRARAPRSGVTLLMGVIRLLNGNCAP